MARGKFQKPRKKRKKALIITCIILFVLLALAAAAYFYLFGTLARDKSLQDLTDEALGIVDVDDGLVRTHTEENITGTSDHTALPEIGEGVDASFLKPDHLPQDALEIFRTGQSKTTSYLTGDYQSIQNFVLYGLDKSNASDSIIILSLDKVHQKLKLISIARDTYCCIPAFGTYSKIGYAYHWGGSELALQTLNTNFYLNIKDYIAVDFSQLASIIDYVGGVKVTLTEAEANRLGGYAPGEAVLNGADAVAYSRIRSIDNDEARSNRQRKVLLSLLETAKNTSTLQYPAMIRDCLSMCTTSLSAADILSIVRFAIDGDVTIEQYFFPGETENWWGGEIDGNWYYVYDLAQASDSIYKIIYEDLYISGYSNTTSE